MRPRRQIIICADDVHDADNLAYVLAIRGRYEPWCIYDVPDTPYPREPRMIVILSRVCLNAPEAAFTAMRKFSDAAVLYISYHPPGEKQFDDWIKAGMRLASPAMSDIMAHIEVLAERRRGPKTQRSIREEEGRPESCPSDGSSSIRTTLTPGLGLGKYINSATPPTASCTPSCSGSGRARMAH